MRTVAIDTSLPSGSVAALDGERAVCLSLGPAGRHAARVGSLLTTATERLGWRLRDVELVAVVRGPGSFTGLRVGVTTAKALAWASGARLVAVSAFVATAARTASRLDTTEPMAVAFDAGRGDVLAATLVHAPADAFPWRVGQPTLAPLDDWIAGLPPGRIATGPAVALAHERLAARSDLRVMPPDACSGDALDAGRLAVTAAALGAGDDPRTLVPDYARESYAEERAGRGAGA